MQGYLFGKPVPSEIFEKKYLARSASQSVLG
jgi:EAL domain-containing protein (putative c-di-GMP-specific phosphodiesterase class I)